MGLTRKQKIEDKDRLESFSLGDTTKQNKVITSRVGSDDVTKIFMATKRIEDGKRKKDELDLDRGFTKTELMDAMDGHVLGSASITGTYATNPRLKTDPAPGG